MFLLTARWVILNCFYYPFNISHSEHCCHSCTLYDTLDL